MKKLLPVIFSVFLLLPPAHAEIKDYLYDGKEIYVHVKKDHLTLVIFPEPITTVIRGFGADTYVVQRNDKEPYTLELMPTDSEVAEMTAEGLSGEDYVLRFVANENPYTKLVIHRMAASIDKGEDKTIAVKMDVLPEATIEKKEPVIQPVPPSSLKTIDHTTPQPAADLPPELNLKITLKGNDLPLKIYLSTISQVTGYNVITTPDIDSQKTSINLENIEVWRALKSLLYKFGYGFKVSEDDLIITETETRIFSINMPAVDQSFSDETSNASFANNTQNTSNTSENNQQNQQVDVGTKIYYQNSSAKLSLWSDLERNVKSLITPRVGSYSFNRVTGSIIVTDKPAVLDKIENLVSTINESLSRQQTFEIQIYEVTLSDSNETGVDWSAVETSLKGVNAVNLATNFSSVGFAAGQLLSLSGNTSNSGKDGISAVVKALASQGDVHTISKPKITVTNLFPAVIQEVTSIPYISGTGQTISNESTISNVTTSEVSDGLTMRLDAKIADDNKTVLNISVAENTLDSMSSVAVGGGLTIQEPQVSTKSITTNVEIVPNKTLILGGLISTTKNNSQEGIPYLDKIPFLGGAFSYKDNSVTKSELVIFITPTNVINSI